ILIQSIISAQWLSVEKYSLIEASELITTHNLGFPRIGAQQELKRALESYWAGSLGLEELEAVGRQLRVRHWDAQARTGLAYVPVGDFAWYDQILEWTALL